MSNRTETIEFDDGWTKIQGGIYMLINILEGAERTERFDSTEYMRLYTLVYDMCIQRPPHDHSDRLYQNYKEVYRQYIKERVLTKLKERHDTALLRELKVRWDTQLNLTRWLSRVFNYLDRYYVERHQQQALYDVGLIMFKDHVYSDVSARARRAILALIEREREGEQIDRYLIRDVLKIFIQLGFKDRSLYEFDFERHLVEETQVYYGVKAKEWIAQDTCPEYMVKAETALRAEEERAAHYLDRDTPAKLMPVVREQLLKTHQMELINKPTGALALLTDNRIDDLKRMYRLFAQLHRNEGLDPIAKIFQTFVQNEGMKIVKQASELIKSRAEKQSDKQVKGDATTSVEQVYVKAIIDLHDMYSKHVQDCFGSSSVFNKALKQAFESFLNEAVTDPNNGQSLATASELLASFCDHLLRKGSRDRMTSDEVDAVLDKVVKLLAYVSDKDMFAGYYQKKLARRLLQDKSVSDEHERTILARLKQQCGAQFTSRMEGMVNDLQLGSEKRRDYEEWAAGQATPLHVDLEVQVLTTGHWPTYKTVDFALPQELLACVERYQRWYENTNNHRKLTWLHSLGQCTIKAHFPSKTYDIILATPQAAIMLLFNDGDEFGYAEIRDRLCHGSAAMPDDDLLRFLTSLCMGKNRLLLKTPESKHIGQQDTFRYNKDFKSHTTRIKIPLPVTEDKRRVGEEVVRDRQEIIDAAIVRIMKARRSMLHQQLCVEVMSQTARVFKADLKSIKRRIDNLIEREYLRRREGQPNMYEYLA